MKGATLLTNFSDSGSARSFEAIESSLTAIWMEVLNLSEINPTVPFLDLGGDSLTAMLCISRIRNHFGIELTIEDFLMSESTLRDTTRIIKDMDSQ